MQNLLGTSGQAHQLQINSNRIQANALSVLLELQADCYESVWVYDANKHHSLLEPGDADEGMDVLRRLGTTVCCGDGRQVSPVSFTHGALEQRVKWLSKDLASGNIFAWSYFAENARTVARYRKSGLKMPERIKKINDLSFVRKEEPGFLERLGAGYYRYLGKKSGTDRIKNQTIDELPSDITLQTLASNITAFAAIIAFSVGALTTFISIWVEWTYYGAMENTSYYLLYGIVLIIMLVIELAVLFWLGLKTVYSLACLIGHHQTSNNSDMPVDNAIPNILARAALEVPDPVIHYLGIDPLKQLSKSKLFLVAALYKAKVILSSILVKFLLTGIFGKGSARTAFSWVGIPITGFWDAFTIYKVAREARLRLFGHKLVEHLVANILTDEMFKPLSPLAREGAIRAVATMMVLAQHYHPNMLILLIRLCETFQTEEDLEYDNWEDFLSVLERVNESERYFLLDLLSVSAAFDGQLSRLEKHHLPEAFKELTEVYMQRINQLIKMLDSGQMHAAKALCTLDFNPG